MRRTTRLALLVLCVLSLVACQLKDKLMGSSSSAPAASSSSSSSTYSSGGSIGVSECDDYIRDYRACLSDKVPEDQRSALESALKSTESGWRQTAMSPEGKAGLAAACQEARDTTANSLQAFGCSF